MTSASFRVIGQVGGQMVVGLNSNGEPPQYVLDKAGRVSYELHGDAYLRMTGVSDDFGDPVNLSYSRRETPAEVWKNRVGITGTLFAIAMSASYFLGRFR